MRSYFFIAILLLSSSAAMAQTKKLNLTNAMVVGQLDKPEDKYTIEINLSELLASYGIKTMASLNVLKQGSDPEMLASDSIKNVLRANGIDTYVLVSVRGYDRNFKPATKHADLATELATGHLFPLYRDEAVSVTFEFIFYRNGEFAGYDLVKLGGIGSRDGVLKKFRKKIGKRIRKSWK